MSEKLCPICEQASGGICRRCLAAELFSDESEEFELPDVLGGFVVRERIGRGASGEVWLAFQPGPDREVALKVFLDPRLGGVADRARFMAEAQALGKLDHPGIVPVYATGEEAGFLFIASRWMPGGTLADRDREEVVNSGQWLEIVRTLITVSRAVAHAHRHGLVHRDIKPANILIGSQGEPYLADFGIAVNEGDMEGHFHSGTPAYMAPEQARGEVVTTSADIYSLGALMFDLLTGKPPLGSEEKLAERMAGIHPDLMAICRKCLGRDPVDRYDSAIDLAVDLERWIEGKPVAARPVGPGMRLLKWAKRRPGVAALSSLAVISAMVLMGTFVVGKELLRKERNYAVVQEQIAKVNERRASIMANNFQQQSYAADMYATGSALADGQRGLARRMLDRHLTGMGDSDVRDFAWYTYEAMMVGDEEAVFADHENSVAGVDCSPDGRFFASSGMDGKVFVREMESQKIVLELPREDAPKGALEIPLMARISLRTPELRERLLSGELNPDELRMRARPSRLGDVDALAWAPNSKVLVTVGGGSFVRFWNFPEGDLVGVLPVTGIKDLAFSGSGKYLVMLKGTSNGGHDLLVYNTVTMERVFRAEDVRKGFAVRGERLAFMKADRDMMTLLPLGDFEKTISWAAGFDVSKLEFSFDGQRLIGLSRTGRELINWDAPSGKLHGVESLGDDSYRALDVFKGGVVLAGSRQRIDVFSGAETLSRVDFLRGHEDEILSLSVSADARWMVSSGKDRSVRLWKMPEEGDAGDGSEPVIPPLKCHGPDGVSYLCETDEGRVYLGGGGRPLKKIGDDHPRRALSFDASGNRMVTWTERGKGILVEWWSMSDLGKVREHEISLPFEKPYQVIAAPGRTRFVVKGVDTPLHFFDLESLEKVGELSVPRSGEVKVILSRAGDRVVYQFWPRYVMVGELGKGWGERLQLTRGNLGQVVFSPDGKWLISGNDENRIVVHEAATGKVVQSLTGHHQRVVSVAMSPDGKTIASSSDDQSLRIWHVPTWRELGVLEDGAIRFYLGFDDDSRHLCVGYWGGRGSSVMTIPRR